MVDLYETIRKSMFAYFCKHHSHIIQENFAVPRKVKIAKKNQRTQPRRYYLSDKITLMTSVLQNSHLDVEEIQDQQQLAIGKAVASGSGF